GSWTVVGVADPVGVVADPGAQLVRALVGPGQRSSGVRRVVVAPATAPVCLRLRSDLVPAAGRTTSRPGAADVAPPHQRQELRRRPACPADLAAGDRVGGVLPRGDG